MESPFTSWELNFIYDAVESRLLEMESDPDATADDLEHATSLLDRLSPNN